MSYDELRQSGGHNITMQDRKRLTVSGVEEVVSYDDGEIVMCTGCGAMTVKGQDLKLDGLSTQTGDMAVTGLVSEISYQENVSAGSLWSRLFH